MTTASLKEATATDKSAILAVIDGMARARYEKNSEAIAAPYAPNAAVFNLAPPLVHHGIDIAETQEWLDSWNGPIAIDPRDFQIAIAEDIAFCYGYMRMTGNKKGSTGPLAFGCARRFALNATEMAGASSTSILPCRFTWTVVCAQPSTLSRNAGRGGTPNEAE